MQTARNLYTYVLFLGVLISPNYSNGQNPPNIVLIVADYMGYADSEPYGSKDIKTPALRKLAEEGIKYTNFYVPAPVCSPSRAALLTGKYPAKTGLERNIKKEDKGLTSEQPTIANKLKEAGYSTGLIGKWHLGHTDESSPNANGFEMFFGFKDWSIDYYSHKTITNEDGLYYNEKPVKVEGYITDIFTDSAITFINKHKNHPFFLSLFYNATLPPLQPHGEPHDIRERSNWWKSSRQDYVKVVERLDQGIGKVMDQLKKNGLIENTIVIFTHDHGGKDLVDHGLLSHGFATLWEGGIRVPLIIRYPKLEKQNITDPYLSINMDLTSTLLTAAGISVEDDLDGVDLFSFDKDSNRSLFWKFGRNENVQVAARKGRWKYMNDKGSELLFDLAEDPGERNDLGNQYPEIKEVLKKELVEWSRQMNSN